jgi:hypothetical protein
MPNLDERLAASTEKTIQLARQKAIKEYAAKERERKTKRKSDNDTRKADAHRKITLGGLVIAAGVDGWNEAEIVGALLAASAQPPETVARFRERGIQHLAERVAKRS